MQSLTTRFLFVSLASLALGACLPAPAVADPGAGTARGTMTGTVVYQGDVPNLPTLDMNADPQCAEQHEDAVTSPVLVLGTDTDAGHHTLGNVLVQITGRLPASPPTDGTVVIDQVGCLYHPRVVGVRVGQTLEVRNSDKIMHNVHFVPKENDGKNLAMPPFLEKIQIEFTEPEPAFPVKCDIHPWMKAWIAVMEQPYFAVTGPDGAFAIEGIPAGTYTAVAWHERLGTVKSQVTVPADGSATVEFVMSR